MRTLLSCLVSSLKIHCLGHCDIAACLPFKGGARFEGAVWHDAMWPLGHDVPRHPETAWHVPGRGVLTPSRDKRDDTVAASMNRQRCRQTGRFLADEGIVRTHPGSARTIAGVDPVATPGLEQTGADGGCVGTGTGPVSHASTVGALKLITSRSGWNDVVLTWRTGQCYLRGQ